MLSLKEKKLLLIKTINYIAGYSVYTFPAKKLTLVMVNTSRQRKQNVHVFLFLVCFIFFVNLLWKQNNVIKSNV